MRALLDTITSSDLKQWDTQALALTLWALCRLNPWRAQAAYQALSEELTQCFADPEQQGRTHLRWMYLCLV